jgi:hypothetical protein
MQALQDGLVLPITHTLVQTDTMQDVIFPKQCAQGVVYAGPSSVGNEGSIEALLAMQSPVQMLNKFVGHALAENPPQLYAVLPRVEASVVVLAQYSPHVCRSAG